MPSLTEPIYTQGGWSTPRWQLTLDGPVGAPPILDVTTAPRFDIGQILHARDVAHGVAEFIYLKAPVGLPAGVFVAYNTKNWVKDTPYYGGQYSGDYPVIPLSDDVPSGAPLAVSMSPFPSGGYGFFMVSGLASVRVTDSIAGNASNGVAVYGVAAPPVAGQVSDTVRTGYRIAGARFANNDSGGLAPVQVNHPTARDDAP